MEGMAPRLSWDPVLPERLLRGLSLGVIGQQALAEPLSRLLVMGRSSSPPGGRMSLAAVLVPSPRSLGRAGATRLPTELMDFFPSRQARGGGFYVLGERGVADFLVAHGIARQVTVTCGTWPLLMQLVGPRTPALPTSDLSSVESALDRFCEVVSATLESAYRHEGLPFPDGQLVLQPGTATVEGAFDRVRQLGRGTAGFLSRLPNSRQPGEVYDPSAATEPGEEPTSFADVGGQDAARAELETICLAVREPDAFLAWGARPPRGVLLYGPPGTGKTLLARALAHEAGARFLQVRATDVVSKWYGEAERRVQQVFDRARSEAPAVLFFDEIDALARDRELAHEATHRMVSTFLENMDGLREVEGVIVLAATNRPEAVDEALMRPGRFDRLVEVPLPDREGRRAIFRVHMRRAERKARRELFTELDDERWSRLLDATEGFSGADVAETVRRALEVKVRSGSKAGRIEPEELLGAVAGIARPF